MQFDVVKILAATAQTAKVGVAQILANVNADPEWTGDADAELEIQQLSYFLATIQHETAATFLPVFERGPRDYFNRYEKRQDLGNVMPGDGYFYRGRGYVQITGRRNYRRFEDLLEIPLIDSPDLAIKPDTAYKIAVLGMRNGLFTGKKLSDYITKDHCDLRNARRIINGLDRADLVAGYAMQWETKIRGAVQG